MCTADSILLGGEGPSLCACVSFKLLVAKVCRAGEFGVWQGPVFCLMQDNSCKKGTHRVYQPTLLGPGEMDVPQGKTVGQEAGMRY